MKSRQMFLTQLSSSPGALGIRMHSLSSVMFSNAMDVPDAPSREMNGRMCPSKLPLCDIIAASSHPLTVAPTSI